MFTAKGLNQVEVTSSFQSSQANAKSINGNTRYQLPVLRINVPAGQSVKNIVIPTGTTLAKVILNVDGHITGTGLGLNKYLVENNSGLPLEVTGSGIINARSKEVWIGPEVGDPPLSLTVNWGYGGAVAANISHNENGSPRPRVHFVREGTHTFKFKWEYSAQDYVAVKGSRELDVSPLFAPLFDANGNWENNTTADYNVSNHYDARGRDVRFVGAASKMINGVRHFWFGSNNKNSAFDLNFMQFGVYYANWMTPSASPGGSGRANAPAINASRSQRSTILSEVNNGVGIDNTYSLANFSGTFRGTVI